MTTAVFLSHAFPDESFVARVDFYLGRLGSLETYLWTKQKRIGPFMPQLERELERADAIVVFIGVTPGDTQSFESLSTRTKDKRIVVDLPGATDTARTKLGCADLDPIRVTGTDEASAERCAKEIAAQLGCPWIAWDEIPDRYLFDYEKHIIDAYAFGTDLNPACPQAWPEVPREFEPWAPNPVSEDVIGGYRDDGSKVLVDAREALRQASHAASKATRRALTFSEAGPRAHLSLPRQGANSLTVGILVSGGIAPGINAVIAGIVSRHALYASKQGDYTLGVLGYLEGLKALLRTGATFKELDAASVRGVAHEGGSILGTSRAEELVDSDPQERERKLRDAVHRLKYDNVKIVYVIGGDGSMRAAHALWKAAKTEKISLSVVAVPKTMDNDVLWVWQSFGFLSAVDQAREAIFHLETEIQANPRVCVIQLFGSDSGFVVSHAALASGAGVCDVALIPEMRFSMRGVSEYMRGRLAERYRPGKGGERPYGMIVMAETAIPTDVDQYLDDPSIGLSDSEKQAIRFFQQDRRVRGQTPDELRTGGLKVVSRVLEHDIREKMKDEYGYWKSFRVFTNEPRHLLRAIPPSVSDVTFGQRLGALAVDNAMAGYTDFMVSQWLTEYVLVPLPLVVLGRKRVPLDGIFWKSVLAMTGQPAELE